MKTKLIKRAAFLVVAWLGLSASAAAIQDSNGNGLSDVWERHYNAGALFSPGNPAHLPGADSDGDGWSNEKECLAGTNPFNASMPTGWVRTEIVSNPVAEGLFVLSWASLEGKTYHLKVSSDLISWADLGENILGTGAAIEIALDAINEDSTVPERLFFRVQIEDEDADGDTLTNWEELQLGTNQESGDTDLDGIPDNLDTLPGLASDALNLASSATYADPDGANAPATPNNALLGFWDFENFNSNGTYPNRASASYPATANPPSLLPGMPSKAISIGLNTTTIPPKVLAGHDSYTISGWIQIGKDQIQNSPQIGEDYFQALFSLYERTSSGSIPQGRGWGLFVRKNTQEEEVWFVGGYKQFVQGTSAKTEFDGHYFNRSKGATDDGNWHHFAVSRSPSFLKVYIDGSLLFSGALKDFYPDLNSPSTKLSFGSLYPGHTPSAWRGGSYLDRLRIHAGALDLSSINDFYHQDIDRDGLWDITEVSTPMWRDLVPNGIVNEGEYSYISSPFQWQPANRDTDGDEATDLQEQAAGTDLGKADSDGDLIPDGWELRYGMNPNSSADGLLDYDNDGLNNLKEWIHNTHPRLANTDGGNEQHPDNVNDGAEVAQGSNPNDYSDGGAAPPAAQKLTIRLAVGDQSGSLSEDYVLHCYRIDKETGEEVRIYTFRSQGFGLYQERDVSGFKKGETYTFQIQWQGTNGRVQPPTGPTGSIEGPDFDYTLKVVPQGDHGGVLVDSWDKERCKVTLGSSLLGKRNDVAATPAEFRNNFSSKRVVFYSIPIATADRMAAGSVLLMPGFENLELKITNSSTLKDFGTHGDLLGGGETRIYQSVEGMLGYQDRNGTLVNDSRVWFLRDSLSYRRTEFYLVSGLPGSSYGKIRIELKLDGSNLGTIEKTLQAHSSFGEAINMVVGWAQGRGFGFDTSSDDGGVTLRGFSSIEDGIALEDPEGWSVPSLIPVFLLHQVEGVTIATRGLGAGIVQGFNDDVEFVKAIGKGLALAGNWAKDKFVNSLDEWRDDPLARMSELHQTIFKFYRDQVFTPLGEIAEDLSTLDGFKKRFWDTLI